MDTICKELEELYPAYVLNAVDNQDRQRIQAHLATCATCPRIVADYRPVADALAFSAPMVEPSADLKYRVLAATMPKRPTRSAPSLISQFSSVLADFFRAPVFAAVTLLLVIALGIWNVSLQNQIAQQSALTQQLQADNTRNRALVSMIAYAQSEPKVLTSTEAAPQAVGRLVAAPELNSLALIVYDMPSLDASRVYQVWLIDPTGNRTSGGTFTVDERGRAWVLIRAPQALDHYQGIGITAEPTGGSPGPTGPKMMGTSL